MRYQTHSSGEKGMVDSEHRLKRLNIPTDLDGKSVLDIGCNEGYFCNVASQRGAKRVVGIDRWESALSTARELYGNRSNIEFIQQDWSALPPGPFDLIIWSSAMHYERDPLSVLDAIRARLASDGLFILECGAVADITKEMVFVQRHDGSLWYPTRRFLYEHLLNDFAFRPVSAAELVGSDPVPRVVIHCRKRKPTLVLFRGETHTGKSSAAQALYASATKVISLDMFLYRVMTAKFHHSDFEKFLRDNKRFQNLTELYVNIDKANLTEEYVKVLAQAIAGTDRVVIIEGYLTDLQVTALTSALKGRVKIWDSKNAA